MVVEVVDTRPISDRGGTGGRGVVMNRRGMDVEDVTRFCHRRPRRRLCDDVCVLQQLS